MPCPPSRPTPMKQGCLTAQEASVIMTGERYCYKFRPSHTETGSRTREVPKRKQKILPILIAGARNSFSRSDLVYDHNGTRAAYVGRTTICSSYTRFRLFQTLHMHHIYIKRPCVCKLGLLFMGANAHFV